MGTVYGEIISRSGVQPDLQKLCMLAKMPPLDSKKELQSFSGIINYLCKFSPSTVKVCGPLRRLTSMKSEQIWNNKNQNLYEMAKSIMKKTHLCHSTTEKRAIYLEIDVYGHQSWSRSSAGETQNVVPKE